MKKRIYPATKAFLMPFPAQRLDPTLFLCASPLFRPTRSVATPPDPTDTVSTSSTLFAKELSITAPAIRKSLDDHEPSFLFLPLLAPIDFPRVDEWISTFCTEEMEGMIEPSRWGREEGRGNGDEGG